MKKFIFILMASTTCYSQQQIPQNLVYRDSVSYFYAWKDSILQALGNQIKKITYISINDKITDTIKNYYGSLHNIISSHDKTRKDIIYKGTSGTLKALEAKGIRDQSLRAAQLYPNMPNPQSSAAWMDRGEVYFKQETIRGTDIRQVNIGLGRNTSANGGLKLFNGNIINFEIIK